MKISLKQFAVCVVGISVLALYGCGGADSAIDANLDPVSASVTTQNCTTGYGSSAWYDGKMRTYSNDPQCKAQIQAAESYRTSAIANCSAGSATGASGNWSYYQQSVSYVNQICPK
jgi:hypothetical protein